MSLPPYESPSVRELRGPLLAAVKAYLVFSAVGSWALFALSFSFDRSLGGAVHAGMCAVAGFVLAAIGSVLCVFGLTDDAKRRIAWLRWAAAANYILVVSSVATALVRSILSR